MKNIKLLIITFLLYAFSFAQQNMVTGLVQDESGVPIPGANVIVKGTTTGAQTDFDGKFSITLSDGSEIIKVSYIGYLGQEVNVKGKKQITITLQEDISKLDEIVVIGYGSVKKSDLTGSVASVSGENLTRNPISSLDQGLKGMASGVQVISGGGEPGAAASIRIRGGSSINASNEPLYVVDGFPISNSGVSTTLTGLDNSSPGLNPLATINPNNIESIQILKDASATAIYGARGANGVVIVTTKRGKIGKPKISYNGYSGMQWVIKELDLLNAEQFVELANRGHIWSQTYNNSVDPSTITPIYETRVVNGQTVYVVKNDNEVTGTDWQDEIFRPAMIQNHQLSASGGSENMRYLLSTNYFEQEGIILNSGFKRLSLNFNADLNVSDKLTIGNSLAITRSENDGVFGTTNSATNSVVGAAILMPSIIPVRNPDGTYAFMDEYNKFGTTTNNPVALAAEPRNQTFANRVLWSVYGEYEILPGLKYKANFGLDYTDTRRELYQPQTYFAGRRLGGEAGIANVYSESLLHESTINYIKEFGKHKVNFLGGFTTQKFLNRSSRLVKTNFPTDDLQNYAIQIGEEFNLDRTGTDQAESRFDSWLGRLNYNFDNKYYITVTGRADGSSRFGSGNKWGFFPSAAVAWRMSEESFLKDNEVLSDLKLRGTYGETGNAGIGNYNSLVRIGTTNTTLGSGSTVGFFPSTPGNPNLQWESTTQYDIGVDFELFDKFNITLDYYNKTTNDLIFNVTLPSSSGYTSIVKNAGSIENKGWEFNISAPIFSGDFSWNVNANLASNKNKVLDLGESDEILVNDALISEGQPLGAFYTYQYAGVFQNQAEIDNTPYAATYNLTAGSRPLVPGHAKIVDRNNDGAITPEDRTFTGDPNPDFIFGITNNLTYKNFSLDFVITGVQGIDIWNRSHRTEFHGNVGGATDLLNSWTPENGSNIPAATFTFTGETRGPLLRTLPEDRQIEDGSFIRLDNLKIGYTFTDSIISGIENVNIYVTGNNLWTSTDYRGYDPDVNSRVGQGNANLGRDNATYPRAKSVLIGLNVTF